MSADTDMVELKPCPFCGCETVRQFHPFEQRGYVIDCNRCNGGFHNIPQDQAIKRWNTRSEASAPVIDEGVVRAMCRAYNSVLLNQPEDCRDQPAAMRAALEAGCAGLVAENARALERIRILVWNREKAEGNTDQGAMKAVEEEIAALRGDQEQGEG